MSSIQVLLSVLIPCTFLLSSLQFIPPERQFSFLLVAIPVSFFSITILFVFKKICTKPIDRLGEMILNARSTGEIEVGQLPQSEIESAFQELLVDLVQKKNDSLGNFSDFSLQKQGKALLCNRPPKEQVMAFLEEIGTTLPDADLFIFCLFESKIHLVLCIIKDLSIQITIPNTTFEGEKNPSVIAIRQKEILIFNELKADPNLGFFLNEKNPNQPVYGAIFPLGDNENQGLLWIRDSSANLERIRKEKENLLILFELMYKLLCTETLYHTCLKPAILYLPTSFLQKGIQDFSMAKARSLCFVLGQLLLNTRFSFSKEEKEQIQNLLLSHCPQGSFLIQEGPLIRFFWFGHEKRQSAILCAKILNSFSRFLALFRKDTPLGHANLGVVIRVPGKESFEDYLQISKKQLKLSVEQGKNLMKIDCDEVIS